MQSPARLWFWAALAAATLACFGLIWLTSLPLGISGEWTWSRGTMPADFPLSLFPLTVVAGAILLMIGVGAHRIAAASRIEVAGWLTALACGAFIWLWTLQESGPVEFRLSKAAWVLYYSGPSGYFTEARQHAGDLPSYLKGYEARMAQGDVLHLGTHPPGLVVAYRALMSAVATCPALRDFAIEIEPISAREAFDLIAEHSRASATPFTVDDRAVLWLAALLMQLAASLTVIPLYLWMRSTYSRSASWLAAALFPFVPALAIFLPKSDASLLPLMATSLLAVAQPGWRRGSFGLGLAAGCIAFIGLSTSLALLPVVVLCGLLWIWEAWLCERQQRIERPLRKLAGFGGAALAAFLLFVLLLWLGTGMNLLHVWTQNYANHAGFYRQFSRTYWKWLLVNPLEFAVASGPALAVAAVAGCIVMLKRSFSRTAGLCWCCLLVGLLLLLSGKNMGEAGRLWI
ncbi:MAG TPA: hypothetical protein VHB77_17390, partial [Planctomycetaceae bacterium]|nr:hypothetical protein [Planctomycetaceae bacterium]